MPFLPSPRPCFECHCGDHVWTATTKGYVVLVSPEDKEHLTLRAWTAAARDRTIYAQSRIRRRLTYLHTLIVAEGTGQETDHINHWGMDNRRANLRNCSRKENMRNARSFRTQDRTSLFKGVHWSNVSKKWAVQININENTKTREHIGLFASEEDAARAYDKAARKHFGAFAVLNFRGEL